MGLRTGQAVIHLGLKTWKGVSKVYLHCPGGCAGAEFVGDSGAELP